jgi:hypothetical protein
MVQTLRDGEVVGWDWLFPPYRWSADARALEKIRATAIDGRCIREKCEQDCALGYELMKRLAFVVGSWLQSTRLQMLDLYGVPTRGITGRKPA